MERTKEKICYNIFSLRLGENQKLNVKYSISYKNGLDKIIMSSTI